MRRLLLLACLALPACQRAEPPPEGLNETGKGRYLLGVRVYVRGESVVGFADERDRLRYEGAREWLAENGYGLDSTTFDSFGNEREANGVRAVFMEEHHSRR